MNARIVAIAACMLSTLLVCGAVRAEDEDGKGSFWMQKKLQYTQAILEGLTSGDFEKIAKNAHSMNVLSHMEKWVRAGSSEYRSQLKIFENANEQLVEMAGEENLDGASIAYVQLTLSCVNCHKVVRDTTPISTSRSK